MTEDFFANQMVRLKIRFGNKPFDFEFQKIIAAECKFMTHPDFLDLVSFLIATKSPTRPPLLEDFRNGRIAADRRLFDRNVQLAMGAMNTPWQKGLPDFLAKEYPGCKTINDAVNVQILKNQIKGAG